ncbi:MAG: GAF domain-containing protein, partial [Chloroflexi bacterium]
LEPHTLLQTIVDLTKERFRLYHAHIYLLNEAGDHLELTAGAGRVGRQMVREGWHIPLDRGDSIVARCARARRCVVVNDVQTTPGYFPNPLLPDTRSEMAVPLVAGQELLGVLDVQAAEVNYFTPDDERILTALASLAATAIHNARLYNKTQQALAEMERSHNLLRSVIDATPDWILIRDREQRYRLVNRGYAGAFQRAPEEFLGKTDREVGLPEEFVFGNLTKGLRGFLHDDAEVLTTGEPMVNPYEPVEIDGKLRIFHSIRTPLTDVDGEVWAVMTFARDVTEREQLLANTESLYQAGASLNQAQTFDDVLTALRKYTVVGEGAVNVSLNLFNRPWSEDQQPDWIDVMARWNRLPIERFQDRYQLADFPAALDMLHADDITVISDVNTDPRLDDHSRQLYRDVFGVQSTLIAPLVVGGEWIGFISAIYQEPTEFSDTDLRRLKSLSDQAAVAVRGIYQLQTARRLLHREQTIREITERMHAATNLQELLRVTAQELGERLDAGHTVIEMGFQPGD